MKKFLLSWLFVFGLFACVSAQSGRRVRTVPTPAATPSITLETSNSAEVDSVGYSESAPNRARPIFSSRRSEEKSKSNNSDKQTKQPNTAPSPEPAAADNAADDDVVKVETNLVSIPVSVYDRNGLYISGLQQKDFKIFDNGQEQEVAYFGKAEQPFTVILLIDVSPSTAYKIEEIQDAAVAFVNQLKPQDQVLVIQFDDSVKVLTELTNDREKIKKAIYKTGFGEGTSLYEAVDFSFRKRLNKIPGKKAIVLFTDGVDTSSYRATFESTIRDAEESEAVVFPIYYNTFLNNMGIGGSGGVMSGGVLGLPPLGNRNQGYGTSSEEYSRGRTYLQMISEATGGRVFRAESTPGGLTAAFEGIAEELGSQYSIGFYPKEEGSQGQRREIKVRVNRPRLIVRARDNYIVGGQK